MLTGEHEDSQSDAKSVLKQKDGDSENAHVEASKQDFRYQRLTR